MKSLVVMIFVALWISDSTAQLSIETDIGMMQDDNIDNNYLQLTDRITTGSLELGYTWSSETNETGIFYTGTMNYYSSLIDRTHLMHRVSFQYSQDLGDENTTALDFDAGFSARVGRELFNIYDHQIYHLNAGIQHDFDDITSIEGNYLFQLVHFKNLPDFNYTEHNIGGQFTASFETRTSITLQSNFGLKIYADQTTSVTDTSGGSGSGHGSGSGGGGISTITQTSSPSVTQMVLLARLGQSIFDNTGISLAGQYQWNIRKESRYLLSGFGPIPDDIIFDDHYGYQGLLLSFMITQVLPFETRLRLAASNQDRLYSTLPAYDLAGNLVAANRNDKRSVYSLQLKKDFESIGFSLNATYDYIINSSNDLFYDYTNRVFTLGITLLL